MNTIIPKRDIGLAFQLDTNRINSRQKDSFMNQIEKWHDDGVIFLIISEPMAIEAQKGNSIQRQKKLLQFQPIMETLAETREEKELLKKISIILFDQIPEDENKLFDVEIVCKKILWQSYY